MQVERGFETGEGRIVRLTRDRCGRKFRMGRSTGTQEYSGRSGEHSSSINNSTSSSRPISIRNSDLSKAVAVAGVF